MSDPNPPLTAAPKNKNGLAVTVSPPQRASDDSHG